MQTNLVLLMLLPSLEKDGPSYDFISSNTEDISVPSIEIEEKLGSIDNILHSILEYHLGKINFDPTYILYDVILYNQTINIYYYVFLPFNTEIKNGYHINIETIKSLPSYQKLIQKISR